MTFKTLCLWVAAVGLFTPPAFFAFYALYMIFGGFWAPAYVVVTLACLAYGLTE